MVRDGAMRLLAMRVGLCAMPDGLILRRAASRRIGHDKGIVRDKVPTSDRYPATRIAPELCTKPRPSKKQRAQGMPGAPIAPAASRAIKNKAHERSHHGHTGITRHSPRNGFNSL